MKFNLKIIKEQLQKKSSPLAPENFILISDFDDQVKSINKKGERAAAAIKRQVNIKNQPLPAPKPKDVKSLADFEIDGEYSVEGDISIQPEQEEAVVPEKTESYIDDNDIRFLSFKTTDRTAGSAAQDVDFGTIIHIKDKGYLITKTNLFQKAEAEKKKFLSKINKKKFSHPNITEKSSNYEDALNKLFKLNGFIFPVGYTISKGELDPLKKPSFFKDVAQSAPKTPKEQSKSDTSEPLNFEPLKTENEYISFNTDRYKTDMSKLKYDKNDKGQISAAFSKATADVISLASMIMAETSNVKSRSPLGVSAVALQRLDTNYGGHRTLREVVYTDKRKGIWNNSSDYLKKFSVFEDAFIKIFALDNHQHQYNKLSSLDLSNATDIQKNRIKTKKKEHKNKKNAMLDKLSKMVYTTLKDGQELKINNTVVEKMRKVLYKSYWCLDNKESLKSKFRNATGFIHPQGMPKNSPKDRNKPKSNVKFPYDFNSGKLYTWNPKTNKIGQPKTVKFSTFRANAKTGIRYIPKFVKTNIEENKAFFPPDTTLILFTIKP